MNTENKKQSPTIVLTVSEKNIPRNYTIVAKLKNGNYIVVHNDYLDLFFDYRKTE